MHGSVLTDRVDYHDAPSMPASVDYPLAQAAECTVEWFVACGVLNLYDACMLCGTSCYRLPMHGGVLQVMWRLTMMPLPCPCMWTNRVGRAAECTVNGLFCDVSSALYDACMLCVIS
jgi:hypothetical protein